MVTTRSSKGNFPNVKFEGLVERITGKRSRGLAPGTEKAEPKKQRKNQNKLKQEEDTQEGDGKDVKSESVKAEETIANRRHRKLEALLKQYPDLPLAKTSLEEPGKATPDTLLALLLYAIFSSTRVSHTIASKTIDLVIKAGYHKIDVLKKTSWQERMEILTEGGLTPYREKTATLMGEVALLIDEKYGDLHTLIETTWKNRIRIRNTLKTLELGDTAIDAFFTTSQHLCPRFAPRIDPRDLKTAVQIGLGKDKYALWKMIGADPESMVRLACALTDIRLEKKEKEWARRV